MIGTLVSLTLRGLLNRRRTLLLALLAGLIVLVAGVFRLSGPSEEAALGFTAELLADVGLAALLPLVAVIAGTAAIGSELDDGTVVYLLAKPVPRAVIVTVKLLVCWVVVTCLVSLPMQIAGIVGGGTAELGGAYAVAAAVGALEYSAIFLALSLVTSRSLVIGLAYVVVWEGVVAALFEGTRILSVRQHALAVADALGGEAAVNAEVALGAAMAFAMVVTVIAYVIAVRRLERVELRGETS